MLTIRVRLEGGGVHILGLGIGVGGSDSEGLVGVSGYRGEGLVVRGAGVYALLVPVVSWWIVVSVAELMSASPLLSA